MDFGSLLHIAQQKTQNNKNGIQYYKTKFEPPKKEERTSKNLSANIQKFLARKEAEEKMKAEEARIKKLELLALRAQDSKAKRRVQVMLKRTKSANKSVIDDAIDEKNTAVTLAGPSQPDEDDYGYESQEAAAYYAKMMERYNNMPEEEKFPQAKRKASTNLESTRDRVKAALLREQEEASMPHKRRRRTKAELERDADGSNARASYVVEDFADGPKRADESDEAERKAKARKSMPPPPPPIDFNSLLKIAEKKQFEPIVIEPKKVDTDERPLTKKQRREYEKEKAYLEAKEARQKAQREREREGKSGRGDGARPPNAKTSKVATGGGVVDETRAPRPDEKARSNGPPADRARPPVKRDARPEASSQRPPSVQKPTQTTPKNHSAQSSPPVQKKPETTRPFKRPPSDPIQGGSKKPADRPPKPDERNGPSLAGRKPTPSGIVANNGPGRSTTARPDPKRNAPTSNVVSKLRTSVPTPNVAPRPRTNGPPSDVASKRPPVAGFRQERPSPGDVRPKQVPPNDVVPRQFPPPDVRRRPPLQPPPPSSKTARRNKLVAKKGRIIDDDDSEYDSELDDFIDDGPVDTEDYSKYISEIFGYDKSRYRDMDDDGDDTAMESNYSNILKEEYISAKIGIMEDLEDMKQEQIEKKRKMMMKKQRR